MCFTCEYDAPPPRPQLLTRHSNYDGGLMKFEIDRATYLYEDESDEDKDEQKKETKTHLGK